MHIGKIQIYKQKTHLFPFRIIFYCKYQYRSDRGPILAIGHIFNNSIRLRYWYDMLPI